MRVRRGRVGQRRMELGRGRPQAEGGVTVRAGRVHHVASFALSFSLSLSIPLTISVVVAVSVQHRRSETRVHCAGVGVCLAAQARQVESRRGEAEGRWKKKRLDFKDKRDSPRWLWPIY